MLVGSQFDIPLARMVILLAGALLAPLAAGWLTRKKLPSVAESVDKRSYPLSLVFIVLINYGMFAKFSDYFYGDQLFLLQSVAVAFLCFGAYSLAGFVSSPGSRQERAAGLISMTYVNNVLVAVFAFQFFGSPVAALAALYNIPYYAGIIAIKRLMPKC